LSPYRAQIAAALDAIAVRSRTEYSWLGQVFEGDPGELPATAGAGSEAWLARRLHPRLYADFYLTGAPAPASGPLAWRLDLERMAATEGLSAANVGRGHLQPGWVVSCVDGEGLAVVREGLEVWVEPSEIISVERPVPGMNVALRLPKDRLGASEGFYTMFGDAGQGGGVAAIDRFYWHLRPDGARLLVAAASVSLNLAGLPFRLKVANDSRGFHRCDTAVLYTRREDRPQAFVLVEQIRADIAPGMRHAVPALTLRLAPGLAFAEDPGGGESYGSHRCRLIADAVITAWEVGEVSIGGRLRSVADRFRLAGLDLDRPFLGPGSKDDGVVEGFGS